MLLTDPGALYPVAWRLALTEVGVVIVLTRFCGIDCDFKECPGHFEIFM